MSDFRTRPVTHEDAAAVNDLLAAAEAVDRTGESYCLADVVEELGNPMIDLARDWLVVESAGQVVGHARLMPRAPSDGALSLAVDGIVHPEHRQQGIASHLVPLMVARAREYVRERGPELTPVITGNGRTDNPDLATIFEAEGLLADRWSFVMEADLHAPTTLEQPLLPEGYTLSTWEGIDHDEIREVHNCAFVDHPGYTPWSAEMWSQWVAGNRNFRPALSLVARTGDGTVASYIQTSDYDAVTEATGKRDAFVAKVGTVPEHRGRGLAGTMLRLALQRYRAAGFDTSSLDVDSENPTGALRIYERAGFRVTQTWVTYTLADAR